MLIDGGPSNVYKPNLRPRLQELRREKAFGSERPLTADVVMLSHVDDDHVKGLLELTDELLNDKQDRRPPWFQARTLWHNSFDDLIGKEPGDLKGKASVTASTGGGDESVLSAFESHDVAMVLASVEQGHKLRQNADYLEWPVNKGFDGVIQSGAPAVTRMLGEVECTILGPRAPELEALRKAFDEWLAKRAEKKAEASVLAAYIDKSVPNLSSIVVLLKRHKRSMLLTGDARGDHVLLALEESGLVAKGGSIHVDILKVPHHGSAANVDLDFFQRITADHYVFSGDGEHGNPERETLELLLQARPDAGFTLHFTYPIAEIDHGREEDWNKERGKQLRRREQNPNAKVREEWNAGRHGLAALFKAHAIPDERRKIVEAPKPHMIVLDR
jgi:hypothetical protein